MLWRRRKRSRDIRTLHILDEDVGIDEKAELAGTDGDSRVHSVVKPKVELSEQGSTTAGISEMGAISEQSPAVPQLPSKTGHQLHTSELPSATESGPQPSPLGLYPAPHPNCATPTVVRDFEAQERKLREKRMTMQRGWRKSRSSLRWRRGADEEESKAYQNGAFVIEFHTGSSLMFLPNFST